MGSTSDLPRRLEDIGTSRPLPGHAAGAFRGGTLWLTGLPCSGKTTLADRVRAVLERRNRAVEVLDGDVVRARLGGALGYSRDDRRQNALRIGYLCGLLGRHGVLAIAAVVSPYRDDRAALRRMLAPGFLEVHVDCPPEICRGRDRKGMYRRALAGEIRDFTGVDAPYEDPTAPDLRVRTDRETPDESAARVLELLRQRGWAESGP